MGDVRYKNSREIMQALLEGKKLSKSCWYKHCYIFLDELGNVRDERYEVFPLDLTGHYVEYEREKILPKAVKTVEEIQLSRDFDCANTDCSDCPLNIPNEEGKCQIFKVWDELLVAKKMIQEWKKDNPQYKYDEVGEWDYESRD